MDFWRREKSLAPTGNRKPDYLARRPVTKLATIFLSPNCKYEFAEHIYSENCFKYLRVPVWAYVRNRHFEVRSDLGIVV
jgi:hypothetical protein